MPTHKKLKISSETLYLYAPLGSQTWSLPNQNRRLEDLGLKHTVPDEYKDIAQKLKETKEDRNRYIRKFIRPIRSVLKRKNSLLKLKEDQNLFIP